MNSASIDVHDHPDWKKPLYNDNIATSWGTARRLSSLALRLIINSNPRTSEGPRPRGIDHISQGLIRVYDSP